MEFIDQSVPTDELPEYAVRTVNSLQGQSSPTAAQ